MQSNPAGRLSLPARLLLICAGSVSLIAGPVLFLLPAYTDVYFAWAIQDPPTPVFMGASYITAGFGLFLALISKKWSVARTIIPAVIMFAVTQLLATVLHVGIFKWSHPVAWAWLAVYVFAAPIGAAIFVQAERTFRAAPPEGGRFGCLLMPVMIYLALLYALVGLSLILLPSVMAGIWPWPLTPLTARVIGGWFLTVATLAWMLSRQERLETGWAILLALMCLSFWLLVGAIWRRAELTGPAFSTAVYVLVTALLGGFSAVTLLIGFVGQSRRPRAQPATAASE